MKTISEYLEDILKETGGFGRFQYLLHGSILMSKVSITWSLLIMAFAGASPDWWCEYNNVTSAGNGTISHSYKTCTPPINQTSCNSYIFADDMKTIISEWGLVCDQKWITATVSSVQMAGLLISGIVGGQLADYFGRKPTFYLSILVLSASNIIAGFSQSWIMFAVLRFIIGLGCGIYITLYYSFSVEFTPIKYRPVQLFVPDWSIWAGLLGLFSWLLHDWKTLHLLTGVLTGVCLLSWWIVPESFRWLVSHDKIEEATMVIKKIARINKYPMPDLSKLQSVIAADDSCNKDRKYTILDLVKNRDMLIATLLVGVGWLSCGYTYYAITYSVEQLSGDLYVNMFLLSVIDIPFTMSIWYLSNRIGRRWTCFCYFLLAGAMCLGVAISQMIDTNEEKKKSLVRGFAVAAKVGASTAWAIAILFTAEVYPTVIRNLGYGVQNSVSRIGALLAPQLVVVNKENPGVMYIISAVVMAISALTCMKLKETKDVTLSDTLDGHKTTSGQEEKEQKLVLT